MLGAIIGDIIGSRWEFNATNEYDFELFSNENNFTDDTICTIGVADALLHGSDNYGAYIHKWCQRYPHPMGGYGGNFAKWVASVNPQPYGSYGNGSAMRVSPIGMWFDNEEYLSSEAEKTAVCTHNHPEGIKGAQAIAQAVYWAVKSFDGPMTQEQMDQEIANIVSSLLVDYDYEDLNYEDHRNRFDETCQGTVPVALDIILKSHSFEDAIRRAVSLGADADTLGAIVGSIAEHIWGIPHYIANAAMRYLPTEMQQIVREFYKKCNERATYKPRRAEKEEQQKREFKALMHWKLGLGNINKTMAGESPLPRKDKIAISSDWHIEPMPESTEEASTLKLSIPISDKAMAIIQKGHIPEVQEDHWFMYCDDEYIRYYRSWTGMCAFEAHYHKETEHYIIDELTIMVLPNARAGRHTLNTFRGTYPQWRDYIDKFVGALHQQLTEPQRGNSELFQQLVSANIKDFEPYRHQEGFELLMDKLLLNDCISQEGKPKQLFNTVYHWDKRLTRDLYLRHINQYLDFCESFIEKRSAKMVKILASKMGY